MLLLFVMCFVAAESINHSFDLFIVLEISATPSSSAVLELSLFPVLCLLMYGQFFTMCPSWLHLKHLHLCIYHDHHGWPEHLIKLKFWNRPPRPPLAPPRGWNLPRYDDFSLVKSALSDSCFSFFSVRFMYSSIENPFTFSRSRSSTLRALKLVKKLSCDSRKLPNTTVANFFDEMFSFISPNCSAREVMWVKCCIKSAPSFILAAQNWRLRRTIWVTDTNSNCFCKIFHTGSGSVTDRSFSTFNAMSE